MFGCAPRRQALEALLSNVEQPQSASARRRRGSAVSQERLEEDQAAACEVLAVGGCPEDDLGSDIYRQRLIAANMQRALGERMVAKAALVGSQEAGHEQDQHIAVSWTAEADRKLEEAEAVRPMCCQHVRGARSCASPAHMHNAQNVCFRKR